MFQVAREGLVGASCLVVLPDSAATLDGVVVAAFR